MKNALIIIGGIIVVGVLGLLGYAAVTGESPGSIIAGLALLWGSFKAKLFGSDKNIFDEYKEKFAKEDKAFDDKYAQMMNEIQQIKNSVRYLETERLKIETERLQLKTERIQKEKENKVYVENLKAMSDEALLQELNDF